MEIVSAGQIATPAVRDEDQETAEPAFITSVSEPDVDPLGKERTRRSLAWVVVVGYLCLLTVNLGGMLVLVVTGKLDATEAKDMMLAISSALGGLLGAVGFVVGYYFKTGEALPPLSGETPERP